MNSKHATYTGFKFESEGHQALAVINVDLKKNENKSAYPHAVFVEIFPDSYNENGHPVNEEYDYIVEVEKTLIDYLEEQTKTVHVGHVLFFRAVQFIFYTHDKEAVEDYLEHYLSTIEKESSVSIEYDAEWEQVSAFYDLL